MYLFVQLCIALVADNNITRFYFKCSESFPDNVLLVKLLHRRRLACRGRRGASSPLVFSIKLLLLDTDDAAAAPPLIGCWLKRK